MVGVTGSIPVPPTSLKQSLRQNYDFFGGGAAPSLQASLHLTVRTDLGSLHVNNALNPGNPADSNCRTTIEPSKGSVALDHVELGAQVPCGAYAWPTDTAHHRMANPLASEVGFLMM
jgi:hypothetical protein